MSYHMRMKDLVAEQRTTYKAMRGRCVEMELQLNAARYAFRKAYHTEMLALTKKQEEEKAALRQKHLDDRARASAEKALVAKSKLEPDFWTDHPNYDGRRDTMTAILKSLGMPVENLDELMLAYAEWLLTANKMHENGRPMNRWALMTAFAQTRLVVPKRMLKPESVIVQMLVERGDLVVGHIV